MPTIININFSPFSISNLSPEKWIEINNNTNHIDCLGLSNGFAICDDCNICNGYNENMDDCGICFGNNQDMDQCGECFGDDSTCLGCTDEYAINYDENAIIDYGNCRYHETGH